MTDAAPVPVRLGVWLVRADGSARCPLEHMWHQGGRSTRIAGLVRWRSGRVQRQVWPAWEWRRWYRAGGGAPAVTATESHGARHQRYDPSRTPMRASDALWRSTGRRRLTVQECARLQDFPNDYQFAGTVASRYAQVGNAVPPRLAEVVVRAACGRRVDVGP